MSAAGKKDEEKIAELGEIIRAVRERARTQRPAGGTDAPGIRIAPADLMPVVHARDAAQAKIAAIGGVNPRAGGLLNSLVQNLKRLIARSLQWFVRDQIVFNRETVAAVEALMEAAGEQNRALLTMASQVNEQFAFRRELDDIRTHWVEWRADWERRLSTNEIQFLRSVAELQGAFQHRVTLIDSGFREMTNAQHANYLGALDRSTLEVQKRLWDDLLKIREEFERLIQTELRLIRQRAPAAAAAGGMARPEPPAPVEPNATDFDYARFAERFRGAEEYVARAQEFYKPVFAGRRNVLDLGCGRGEFLEAMRAAGVEARGIELSEENVALCAGKGLRAEKADLFDFLALQPDKEFDGIMCSQVVEHLPPARLPELIRLCAAKLVRGGVLAIETPNPECLAIFATHFYLDPTHTRPVPHPLLVFYMEESGLGSIEVHSLSPAVESFPEIAELPLQFRERFFGGLDYAIVGRRL